jgi:tetratricopeptide (TPR) repeat protein
MPPHCRHAVLVAMAAAALAGCQARPAGAPAPGQISSAPREAAMPVPDEAGQDIEAREEAEFRAAVAGLDFATGVVVVRKPPATPDREAATRHYAEGLEDLDGNRRTEAVAAFTLAVRSDPQWPAAYQGLGQALIHKGEDDLALAAFRTAAGLDPDLVEAQFSVATTLDRLGRRPEAIEQMLAVVRLDPENADAQQRLAIWYYYEQDLDAAWRHVEAAEALGHRLPGQFMARLEAGRARPGAGAR